MYYKVVKFNDLVILSAVASEWAHEYKLHVPTRPIAKQSKLFVFNDLQFAQYWKKYLRSGCWEFAIYECQVENPIPATCRSHFLDNYNLCWFWNSVPIIYDFSLPSPTYSPVQNFQDPDWQKKQDDDVPPGTFWVDSVTLTKLVE